MVSDLDFILSAADDRVKITNNERMANGFPRRAAGETDPLDDDIYGLWRSNEYDGATAVPQPGVVEQEKRECHAR